MYGARYQKPEAALVYYNQVLQRLRATPGIESVAMTSELPLGDFDRRGFHIRDRRPSYPFGCPQRRYVFGIAGLLSRDEAAAAARPPVYGSRRTHRA